jgi:hypothetical protein
MSTTVSLSRTICVGAANIAANTDSNYGDTLGRPRSMISLKVSKPNHPPRRYRPLPAGGAPRVTLGQYPPPVQNARLTFLSLAGAKLVNLNGEYNQSLLPVMKAL